MSVDLEVVLATPRSRTLTSFSGDSGYAHPTADQMTVAGGS